MRLSCVLPRSDQVICTYDVNPTAPLAVDILRSIRWQVRAQVPVAWARGEPALCE
jgi:hypothetical protein